MMLVQSFHKYILHRILRFACDQAVMDPTQVANTFVFLEITLDI